MSEFTDDKIESLFRDAAPRAMPDEQKMAAARAAVHAEWRQVTRKRRRRQFGARFAIAATVLVGAFVAFNTFRGPAPETVDVAAIQKSYGAVYILGPQSTLTPAGALSTIRSGQTIVTGANAGMALAWAGGGSVRLDRDSEVLFVDTESVRLTRGRIYFDSAPAALIASTNAATSPQFSIATELGSVSHVGTQFMVAMQGDTLAVAVREGHVEIDGHYYDTRVPAGKAVRVEGRGRPVLLDVARYGDDWQWVTQTSPAVGVDGHSLDDFLQWASRELGLGVRYRSEAIRQTAQLGNLVGTIDLPPDDALRHWMSTTGIEWRINGGVIEVGPDE